MKEKLHHDLSMGVRVRLGASVLAATLLAGCTAYIGPPVTPELADHSSASLARLQRGSEIHQQSCAKCHPYEDPANYSEQEWRSDIMPRMADEAKLGPEDRDAVLDYLLAARHLSSTDGD